MIRPGVNVLCTARFNIPILRSRIASVPAQRYCQIHLSQKSRPPTLVSSPHRRFTEAAPQRTQPNMDGDRKSGRAENCDIRQINPFVTRILGQNPGFMTLGGTNSYLLNSPSDPELPLFLIDTTSRESADEWVELVMARIDELYEEAKKTDQYKQFSKTPPMPYIQCIFLTHRHKDHTGGLVPLLEAIKKRGMPAPIVYKMPNPDEAEVVLNDPETSDAALIDSLKGAHIKAAEGPIAPLAVPKTDGMLYQNADRRGPAGPSVLCLQAMHTPGHTADSMTYLVCTEPVIDLEPQDENKWFAFVGDTVLGSGTGIFTDYAAYMDSLKRLDALRPGWLFTGHGRDIRWENLASDKLREYMHHRKERHEAIKTIMQSLYSDPKSLGQTIENTRKMAKAAGEQWVAQDAKNEAILKAGGAVPYQYTDPGTKASHLLAKETEPIGDKFIGECEDVPGGITLPLLCTLVYKSNVPSIVRAASISMRAHLLQFEKDGLVRRRAALMPGLNEWRPTAPEEQEVWEWTGDVAAPSL